jgi:hypothetical protein
VSVSPGYVIAHRVTQVQQILCMDIIFVKKNNAFFLSMFTPLGLGLVRHLHDRSKAEVGTPFRLMLVKATSRSFDTV